MIECSLETAIERMKGRGFSEEEAKQRISSQWKNDEREKFADVIIVNSGSREELEAQVNKHLYYVFSKCKTQSEYENRIRSNPRSFWRFFPGSFMECLESNVIISEVVLRRIKTINNKACIVYFKL